MKDKRIWIVIGCILVIGSGVTYHTNSYVRSQVEGVQITAQTGLGTGASGGISAGAALAASLPAGGVIPETAAYGLPEVALDEAERSEGALASPRMTDPGMGTDSQPPGSDSPVSGSIAADSDAAYAAAEDGSAQDSQTETAQAEAVILEAGPEAAAFGIPGAAAARNSGASEVPISPLTGAKISSREERTTLITDYRQRLEDLDNQIQKMREEDTAETSSNVYSIRTSAETELKLWEGELGTIYNALLEMLSQEDAAALAAEQQEWLKNREVKAAEGSVRNGSVERLGYAAVLVSLTRERAYELVGRYEEANGILSENEGDLNGVAEAP